MAREIILDTETTGLDPAEGHRLVEFGAVEVMNYVPTGRQLHIYINPDRDVPAEAVAVHGLTRTFLSDKPHFAEIFTDILDFIGDAPLVIHNAEFDMRFLNAELKTVGHPALKNKIVDTLLVARRRFPGSPASLDALCRRFNIDNSNRDLHGALLDSQLLAEVYLELMGGRQHGLGLNAGLDVAADAGLQPAQDAVSITQDRPRKERPLRHFAPNQKESAAHEAMVQALQEPVWKDYSDN
jgi:DNA polymerase-3 subunit epsilon